MSRHIASGKGAVEAVLRSIRSIEDTYQFVTEVAKMHGLKLSDLRGPCRLRGHVEVRDLCSALLCARGFRWPQIGIYFIGRDASTVQRQARQFFDRDIRDPWFAQSWSVLAPRGFAEVDSYEELMTRAHVEPEPGVECWVMEAAE